MWQPPSITLKWGSYVKADEQAQLFMVQAVQGLLGGPTQLITTRLALEKLRESGTLTIENISAVLEALEDEKAEAVANAQAAMAANPPAPRSAPKPGEPAPPAAAKPVAKPPPKPEPQ